VSGSAAEAMVLGEGSFAELVVAGSDKLVFTPWWWPDWG
jgi:hypothetical protein